MLRMTCPVCDEWLLVHKLCADCDKIRHLCKLYGKQRLLGVLDKTMVIQQLKPKNDKNDDIGDESHDH